jgi:thiol:disulfide interchange protein DsbC
MMMINETCAQGKRALFAIPAMHVLRAKLFAPVLAGLITSAIAQISVAQSALSTASAVPTSAATSAMGSRLQALYPSTRFGAINPTPWPGVFEVVMGANLAYVDESGQYFLFGHLYDMKSQRDLTAERKDSISTIDFDALPMSDAMTEVRGNGARVMAIFSDPDCPYCQKLESDIRDLTNVTIYTFLMPLVSLHPAAHSKAVSIWCASDRTAAWHAMMWRGEAVPQAECPHPVDRNVALGERLGINGTPTLIALDGRMLPGAASKEQIEAWLQRSVASADGGGKPKVSPR